MDKLETDVFFIRRGLDKAGYTDEVQVGQPVTPEGYNYRLIPYAFTGETQNQADGCLWIIPSRSSTKVVRVERGAGTFQDVPIEGAGYFLGIDPKGNIITYQFSDLHEASIVEYGEGWVITWIGVETEFQVVGITEPPFRDDMETAIDLDDPSLPKEFLETYWKLRGRRNTEES